MLKGQIIIISQCILLYLEKILGSFYFISVIPVRIIVFVFIFVAEKEQDILYEIVFEDEFLGGLTIRWAN